MAQLSQVKKAEVESQLSLFSPVFDSLANLSRNTGQTTSLEKLLEILPDTSSNADFLKGIISILYGMGLLNLDNTGIISLPSREAGFFIASIASFIRAGVPVGQGISIPDAKSYYVKITRALEKIRQASAKVTKVDDSPIHFRRIVNVVLKSRQVRGGKYQDVFLLVYHPVWQEYHLIGLSHKNDALADNQIAELSLQQNLGLMVNQYELTLHLQEYELTQISETSGALTKYTYCVYFVNEIKVELDLQKLINNGRFPKNWFRWFTWEEIQNLAGEQGEKIIFSTPVVLRDIYKLAPISVKKAKNIPGNNSVASALKNRFTYPQLVIFLFLIAMIPIANIAPDVAKWLGTPNALLDNLGSIADITSLLLPVPILGILIKILRE